MALLVGASSISTYNSNGFFGYQNANISITPFEAVLTGTATTLHVAVNSFGANTQVSFGLYESTVAEGGTATLIATVVVPSSAGAYPQSAAFSGTVNIVAGRFYRLLAIGDVTASNGAEGYTYRIDPSYTTPGGIDSLYNVTSMPATITSYEHAVNGQMYFWIDGTAAGAATPAVSETFLDPAGNTPITGDVLAYVTSLAGVELLPVDTYTLSSGVITIQNAALGAIDDVVSLCVRKSAESDPLISFVCVPSTVYDAGA